MVAVSTTLEATDHYTTVCGTFARKADEDILEKVNEATKRAKVWLVEGSLMQALLHEAADKVKLRKMCQCQLRKVKDWDVKDLVQKVVLVKANEAMQYKAT